jgi:glyoxylase-like metal-dependent hydrolase (beta-lactamase superfamily II)
MAVVEKDDFLLINKLELPPFGTNAYILICQATKESVLVDAPGSAEKILENIKETDPKYILMTHSHMDHTAALGSIKRKTAIPIAAHPEDAKKMPLSPDLLLKDGDIISFGKIDLKTLHTPGHTPGSLCFLTGKYLISGDTLFPGGPGKTGTPADFKEIIESITKKLFVLQDDIQIYPGHGTSSNIGKEKKEFALFSSRPHPPYLCGDVLWLSS